MLALVHHLPGVFHQIHFTTDVRQECHEEILAGINKAVHGSTSGRKAAFDTAYLRVYSNVQTG